MNFRPQPSTDALRGAWAPALAILLATGLYAAYTYLLPLFVAQLAR